jgi:Fe-S cluster biogenesis protein NfuA
MPPQQNLRSTGDRIELLLDELQNTADPRSCELASEVLRLVSDLYGAGLTRVVELARERAPDLMGTLVEDDLVASLLLVHGLHPETLERRILGALESVRPLLAAHGGDVELLGIDSTAGSLQLRLLGSCDGCPSSEVTLRLAVERAITEAAPEIVTVEVDQSGSSRDAPSVPVSMGTKPVYEACPAEMAVP